jgi:hypothetical protein
MTSAARAAAVCLAALSLVAVGCGGDTKAKNEYVDAVNKAQADFADNVKKVGSSAPSGSDPVAAAKQAYTALGSAIDKVIADLKAVEPPDDVKALHSRLITQLSGFGGEVDKAVTSLSSGDLQAIAKAQADFAKSASTLGTQISKTLSEINTKLQS